MWELTTRCNPGRHSSLLALPGSKMADASLLPRRIVKETQRLLSEQGALELATGCVWPRVALPSLHAARSQQDACQRFPSRLNACLHAERGRPVCTAQHRASAQNPTRTTCGTSTSKSRAPSNQHTKVRADRRPQPLRALATTFCKARAPTLPAARRVPATPSHRPPRPRIAHRALARSPLYRGPATLRRHRPPR